MKVVLSTVAFILLVSTSLMFPSMSYGKTAGASNLGQDAGRPMARVDLRYSLRDVSELLDLNITTLRLDYPIVDKRWTYFFRTDLTYIETKFAGADSVLDDSGLGPTTLVAAMSYQFNGSGRSLLGAKSAVFGFQSFLDTSDEDIDPARRSKTDVAAIAGAKWGFGDYRGFFFPLIKYWQDVEKDINATDTNLISFKPYVNLPFKLGSLPSFLSFYETYDIRYNLNDDGANNKGIHLPINVAIGIKPSKSLVFSLEYASSVIEDFERYDSIIEFRVGHFF